LVKSSFDQHFPYSTVPDSVIEVRCGDIPMFRGKMGRKGETIAVRINERYNKE